MIEFFTNGWNIAVILIGLTLSVVLWIKGKGSDYLRGYIPTLWTSLGILCTFMAIYVSLSGYTNIVGSDGVNGSESNAFDINDLIKEVIPAFSTSIIGIIGAIISTIINRWIGDNQEKADYKQFLKIKNRIPGQKLQSSSPEMVLLEIISAIRETSNQTCEKLRNNNDTSGKKLEQICSRLSTLDSTTSAVGERVKSAISDSMHKQREEFTSAISLLISTLSSELKSQSDGMAKKMDDLRRMLHDEVEHIESTNQNLLMRLIEQDKSLLELTTQTLIKDSESRNKSLQDFITQQSADLEETFGEITAGMGALYQKIEESITNHISEEKSLFEHDIKESIEDFATTQYKTCSDTITKCNQELTSNIEQIHRNHIQTSNEFISKIEDVFTLTCDEFRLRMESLSHDLIIKIDEINNNNMSSMSDTVEQNRQLVQLMITKHSEEIKLTADHVIDEESKIHRAIADEYLSMREKMLEQFNLYLAEVQNAMNDTRNQLEVNSQSTTKISSDISNTLSSLISDVQKSDSEFLTNLSELKEQIVASAISSSKDIQNTIFNSSQIKQLEAMAENMTSVIGKTIASMNSEMAKVSAVINSSVEAIEKSAEIYSDAVAKSDTVTRYMESTSHLFMEHNNAISILEKSLQSMENSITNMRDVLISQGDRKTGPKSVKK